MKELEFDTYVLPLRDKMFRFARSILLRSDDAEDVTHDVLERLWCGRERLGECRNVEAFAMTALRNGCYDRLRRRRLREQGVGEYPRVEVPDGIGRWSDKLLITQALSRLPQTQREVLHLKDIEGYETHEIARMTVTPENQIRVILSRARKRLRDEVLKMMEVGNEMQKRDGTDGTY